ncbi:MAG: MBL fold metallo-hydrolase [Solirubrobacterales bacterium]|nr:MBL fold metallo-hydrolase [Solirubrobacterales bacterium]
MNALTYVGHATVEIEMDGVRLLTDPVLRKRIVHLRRQVPLPHEPFAKAPDAILLSHQHFDHLDLPSLRGFGPETGSFRARAAAHFSGKTALRTSRNSPSARRRKLAR